MACRAEEISDGASMKITTEEDYYRALSSIHKLWVSKQGTPEGDELDKLIAAVIAYEDVHHATEGDDNA